MKDYTVSNMRNFYFPGSFSILHEGHLAIAHYVESKYPNANVIFEICHSPYGKDVIIEEDMNRRFRQFKLLNRNVVSSPYVSFLEKTLYFPNSGNTSSPIEFLVGLDTIERINNPAFYFNSAKERDRCVSIMLNYGAKFHVFPRHSYDMPELCEQLMSMCVFYDDFAPIDISSTRIRNETKN